ncbi:MAG: MFS transporter [Rhizobiales bacterium]|nr:MFS transporter [Hyphomicrobiales bacterium]
MTLAAAGLARAFGPHRLVMAVFFLHAFVMTNWFPRIPDVQAKLGVGPGDLSLGLLGSPVGTVLALPFAGAIVERLSPRRTIMIAFALYAVGICLPGLATDVPTLFAALFVYGLALPVVDVAMNVEADRIERATGRRIMNTCHGFWSLGSIAGSVVGAGFAAIPLTPMVHLPIIAAVALPLLLAVANALPSTPEPAAEAGEKPPRFALPTLALLPVCIFAFGMLLVESAALDWSGIFLRDVIGVSAGATAFGFFAFASFMTLGRLTGDRLTARFGPVLVARSLGIIGIAGMITLVTATNLVQAAIGLAAAGLGVSVAVPLSVSAAASRGDRAAALNVAALSLVSFSGFLVEPPLVGFISEHSDLRFGLAATIPILVMSTLLAFSVRRGARAGREPVSPLSEV